MKKFFKGKSFDFFGVKLDKSVLYGVLALIALLIGYPKIKQLIADYTKNSNIKAAVVSAGGNVSSIDNVDSNGIRTLLISPMAETLHGWFHSWYMNYGSNVNEMLCSLKNAQEVAALSADYQLTYSESLKTMVVKECEGILMHQYTSLPDYIRNHLF